MNVSSSRRKSRKRLTEALAIALTLLLLLWLFFPFYFMFISAFKNNAQIGEYPPALLFRPSLDAFLSAIAPNSPGHFGLDWPRFFENSFIVSLLATGGALLIGVPAALGLAYLPVGNKYSIAFGFLTLRMLPPLVAVLPMFILMSFLHLLDTYPGLTLEYVLLGLPWVIWLSWSFLEGIPKSIFEAAQVDGASTFSAFMRIILPLVLPGLLVSAVFAFLQAYDDLAIATIIGGSSTQTVTMGLSSLVSGRLQLWNVVFAVGVLNIIPSLVLVFLVRKHWARALSMGLVK
jgi:multiple sugar transport system permease protein